MQVGVLDINYDFLSLYSIFMDYWKVNHMNTTLVLDCHNMGHWEEKS